MLSLQPIARSNTVYCLVFKGIGRRRLEASTIKVVVQVAITFVAAWAVLASATWAVSPATAKPKCQMGVHCRFR